MIHIVAMQYTKSFKLHRGGKAANPQELTSVSDWRAAAANKEAA